MSLNELLTLLAVAVTCVLGFTGGRWLRTKHPRVYWITFPWLLVLAAVLLWTYAT